MKIFKAKYKGRDKILNFSTTSTKAAYNAFLKQGEPQEIEVEVFDGESWTTFDEHIKKSWGVYLATPRGVICVIGKFCLHHSKANFNNLYR